MNILVGCPIYRRPHLVDPYLDHVDLACREAGVEPTFAFVAAHHDIETFSAVANGCSRLRRDCLVTFTDEPEHSERRNWGPERFHHMVKLRNQLLDLVRKEEPDFFWSIDSDILAHPQSLVNSLASLNGYGAVGQRAYMTPKGNWCTSAAMLVPLGGLRRVEAPDAVCAVDVVMACVVHSPASYETSYQFDRRGEDIGHALACAEKGVTLGYDARAGNKHIMEPWQLDEIDPRVGW